MNYFRKTTATIAVIAVTTMMVLSLGSVFATHTADPNWKETGSDSVTMQSGQDIITEIVVNNDGPDPIEKVTIIAEAGNFSPGPTASVSADENVSLVNPGDDNVILSAGTVVTVTSDVTVNISENTEFIRLKGTGLYNPKSDDNVQLLENGWLKVPVDTATTDILSGTEIKGVSDQELSLTTHDNLRLLNDTQVIKTGSGFELPKDTQMEVIAADDASGFALGENIKINSDTEVTLSDNELVATEDLTVMTNSAYEQTIPEGRTLQLWGHDNVVATADTQFQLNSDVVVELAENEEVTRESYTGISLDDPTAAENQPNNWMQESGTGTSGLPEDPPSGDYVMWTGIADNQIASGGSLEFPMALTTPSSETTVYVRTTDTNGLTQQNALTFNVDNTAPSIDAFTASPEWAKANTEVDFTIELDETVVDAPDVVVKENNAPSGTDVSLESNDDNTVWTGTYTTGENVDRDGEAEVLIENYEDATGNVGASTTKYFNVDKVAPTAPSLDNIANWPIDMSAGDRVQTNSYENYLETTATDNYLGNPDAPLKNGTVEIRVGDTVITENADSTGYWWTNDFELPEGKYQIGVTYIDRAGNESTESYENLTMDNTAPSFSLDSIGGVSAGDLGTTPTNTATPTVSLTIEDSLIGIDDADYGSTGDSGYDVRLYENDKADQLYDLTNALTYSRNSLSFENVVPELDEGEYQLFVEATDNLQYDNAWYTFSVDTTKPDLGGIDEKNIAIQGTSEPSPVVTDMESLTLSSTATDESTSDLSGIQSIEVSAGDSTQTISAEDMDGDSWTATLSLAEGLSEVTATVTDTAGNTYTKTYGWILSDQSAPSITVDVPEAGSIVGSRNVTVSGSVTEEVTSVDTLEVRGRDVPVSDDGTFTASVSVDEGQTTLSVSATDEAGNTGGTTVTFTVDATRPIADIASPYDGKLVSSGEITVRGTAYDELTSLTTLTLAGSEITPNEDGTFSETVSLSSGSNTITLSAQDEAGHYQTDTVEVISDTSAPSVTIESPSDETTTGNASVTVTGTVQDTPMETNVTVAIDAAGTHKELSLTGESFSTTVPLPTGDTNITVSATDEVNQTGTASITVTRSAPTNWSLYATIAAIIAIILAAVAIIRRSL